MLLFRSTCELPHLVDHLNEKMMDGIYLLLGSNLDDKKNNILRALKLMEDHRITLKRSSRLYKSEAWGITDQPEFYNQVTHVETDLRPHQLLITLKDIEKTMGRKVIKKWGPRLIDIDILFYNNTVIDGADLQIPHPGIPDRRFTLIPLLELCPNEMHPVLNRSIKEINDSCDDGLKVIPVK